MNHTQHLQSRPEQEELHAIDGGTVARPSERESANGREREESRRRTFSQRSYEQTNKPNSELARLALAPALSFH